MGGRERGGRVKEGGKQGGKALHRTKREGLWEERRKGVKYFCPTLHPAGPVPKTIITLT